MRFYNGTHRFWCGIDLHAKTMYVCILDAEGQVLVHKNLRSSPEEFLETVAPYREGIAFVLGHALMMKAIHGGKAKNDRVDSLKIATLLRGGMPRTELSPRELSLRTLSALDRPLLLLSARGRPASSLRTLASSSYRLLIICSEPEIQRTAHVLQGILLPSRTELGLRNGIDRGAENRGGFDRGQ